MVGNGYIGSFDGIENGAIQGWCKPEEVAGPRAVVEIYE
jgi:hypothetical protein